MTKYQQAKDIVRNYFDAMGRATPEHAAEVLQAYTAPDYLWQGVYPFREQRGAERVAQVFWQPLLRALTRMQRRQDIFIAGTNEIDGKQWVLSMGHFMGLFDADWLGIRRTRKIANLRYAEFNCVEEGNITQTGLFVDVIGLMQQADAYPLPPATGHFYVYPGPRTHDGLLFEDAPPEEGAATLALINKMVADLDTLNRSGSMGCPPEVLARTWHDDMIWYGPAGIGATYTIPRYQEQHQLPFRQQLTDKRFHGHICRLAEGNYGGFFGWPNLSNSPLGGFLGLPGGSKNATMQVVDVYRRQGEKLAENWVFIDLPFWLKQQGLDVLGRTQAILNPE
jgi:hypothetical protein